MLLIRQINFESFILLVWFFYNFQKFSIIVEVFIEQKLLIVDIIYVVCFSFCTAFWLNNLCVRFQIGRWCYFCANFLA